jgi:2',3'-cyclic-nucleotide 3'-phosphodiesterase
MYAKYCSHDCPQVDAEMLASVDTLDVNVDGKGRMGSWVSGRVVLVPTDKPIDQWSPIAERAL